MSEKVLYKPVEDMFVKKGYFSISSRGKLPSERVHSPFGVDVHGVTKKIDVVAFRWIGEEIEAKAVECKYGKTWEAAGEALGQATAYQRLFPEVYIATPSVWHHWRADTEAIARRVEKHFLDKGMKGAGGGGESPNYVYIFI